MTDYSRLPKGVSKIAWGFIFILIHVKINSFDMLPDFVGYILILSGINNLKDECKTISLLRPLGLFLTVWNIIAIFSGFTSLGVIMSYISGIVSIINIYFTFQLLTECSLIAARYQSSDDNLDKTIRTRRNIHTVCITIMQITMIVIQYIPEEFQEISISIPAVSGVVALIVLLMTVSSLFRLKRLLAAYAASREESTEDTDTEEDSPEDDESC